MSGMEGTTNDAAAAANAVAPDCARRQLEQIGASSGFVGAERLTQFLRYVVEEYLAGRGDRLTGRSIAEQVFHRGADFDPQSDAIVRVEAGRLRRRLHLYYATTGQQDPVRIDIPKGGYAPTFELAAAPADSPDPSDVVRTSRPRRYRGLLAATAVVLLALGGAGVWLFGDPGQGTSPDRQRFTVNGEAYNLFLETRRISRPPTNVERVEAAIDLAREVVRLDPEFGGGYAAESFLLWSYVVFGHSQSPADDTARALELANKAVSVQPAFGWGYQSLSRARHLTGDVEGAVTAARYAVELQPDVAELQGNLGILLAFVGRPDEAIAPIQEAIRLAGDDVRNPYWNYIALAYFHAGSPEEAIAAIETNRARGGPLGPLMDAYEAAAHSELGQSANARTALARMHDAPVAFSIEDWVERVFVDAADRRQLFSAIEKVVGVEEG